MTTASIRQSGRWSAADRRGRLRGGLVNWRALLLHPGWICVFAALGLSIIGILAIGTTEPSVAIRQFTFLAMGILATAVVTLPHYRWLDWLSYPLLLGVLALLLFVLIKFVPEAIVRPRNGARRWINLIIFDFQPSELAKIAYVLALATYLKRRRSYRTFLGLLLPMAATFIPLGLVLIEPDLGTALLFLPTLFAMLIAAGAKLKHLVIITMLGLGIAPMLYPVLQPHQQDRIKALAAQVTGDDRYQNDIGFQGAKAIMLVGAGGMTGVGDDHARDLIRYNALPEEHNDMIFAVIACRWGMLGAIGVWGLFLMFCAGGFVIAARTKDPFARLVPIGLITLLFCQMTINTGMTLGLLPITGLTLPFISYGGSSMIASWLMVGLLLNLAFRPTWSLTGEPFDFSGESER